MKAYAIASHVTARWQERVDPTLTASQAGAAISGFLLDARLCNQPPPWMAGAGLAKTRYAINPALPDVALIVQGDVLPLRAVTVVTRALAESRRNRRRSHFGESFKKRSALRRQAPSRPATRAGGHAEFLRREEAH